MKRLTMICTMFLGMLLVAPVWSHHAAAGIVSDETWLMIDALLESSESPHPDMDIDAVAIIGDMDIIEDPDSRVLVSTVEVETALLDYYLQVINDALAITRGIASGEFSGDTSNMFDVLTEDVDENTTLITLYEPIGTGSSQEIPDPDNPAGRRNR